jgi:hypothetical protein
VAFNLTASATAAASASGVMLEVQPQLGQRNSYIISSLRIRVSRNVLRAILPRQNKKASAAYHANKKAALEAQPFAQNIQFTSS